MKKVFVAKNKRADSMYDMPESMHGNHSAGLVILADTVEEAQTLAKEYLSKDITFTEIDTAKNGVVLYCDGQC